MRLFTVKYEHLHQRAIWGHVVLAETPEAAKEIIEHFYAEVKVKSVHEHDISREGIVF